MKKMEECSRLSAGKDTKPGNCRPVDSIWPTPANISVRVSNSRQLPLCVAVFIVMLDTPEEGYVSARHLVFGITVHRTTHLANRTPTSLRVDVIRFHLILRCSRRYPLLLA